MGLNVMSRDPRPRDDLEQEVNWICLDLAFAVCVPWLYKVNVTNGPSRFGIDVIYYDPLRSHCFATHPMKLSIIFAIGEDSMSTKALLVAY
jgi:hypothetical protein